MLLQRVCFLVGLLVLQVVTAMEESKQSCSEPSHTSPYVNLMKYKDSLENFSIPSISLADLKDSNVSITQEGFESLMKVLGYKYSKEALTSYNTNTKLPFQSVFTTFHLMLTHETAAQNGIKIPDWFIESTNMFVRIDEVYLLGGKILFHSVTPVDGKHVKFTGKLENVKVNLNSCPFLITKISCYL
jgi:hypothetical protein